MNRTNSLQFRHFSLKSDQTLHLSYESIRRSLSLYFASTTTSSIYRLHEQRRGSIPVKWRCGLPRSRVEHGRQVGPLGTQCRVASHALIILERVRDMSVTGAGRREVDDGRGRSFTVHLPHVPLKVGRRHCRP